MHQIQHHINQALQNAQAKTENGSTPPTDRGMVYLWEQMTYLFGHKFTSTYGESAVVDGVLTDVAKTWAIALTGITGEQIANGLEACVNKGEAWPPSLPEFVAMCKKQGLNEFGLNHTPQYHHGCYRPIRDRSKLISSDDREKRRIVTKDIIHSAANMLRSKQDDKPKKKIHIPNQDARDYFFMNLLIKDKTERPNIIDRINEIKKGSLEK